MDFHVNPAVQECKKILEANGAKAGEAPFNPAYLTSEVITLPPGRGKTSLFLEFLVDVLGTENP